VQLGHRILPFLIGRVSNCIIVLARRFFRALLQGQALTSRIVTLLAQATTQAVFTDGGSCSISNASPRIAMAFACSLDKVAR
jgi:hypothetical protein